MASPCGVNTINRAFVECRDEVMNDLQKMGYMVVHRFYQGTSISENRNRAFHDAYKWRAEWLIFIDTDMTFETKDVIALFRDGGDVVTGVCKTAEGKYALYDYDKSINNIRAIDMVKPIVDICGGAFLAIRNNIVSMFWGLKDKYWKNVLVRDFHLNYPFNLVTSINGAQYGEDVSFCLRLMENDIKIHVAEEAIIGHEKMIEIK